jgi:hypothetical protein
LAYGKQAAAERISLESQVLQKDPLILKVGTSYEPVYIRQPVPSRLNQHRINPEHVLYLINEHSRIDTVTIAAREG